MEATYIGNHAVWTAPFGGSSGPAEPALSAITWRPMACTPFLEPVRRDTTTRTPVPCWPTRSARTAVTSSWPRRASAAFSPIPASPPAVAVGALYPSRSSGRLSPAGAPTGDSKYDSLQVKATKRLSHSLQAGGAYTWGQGFTRARPGRTSSTPQSDRVALQQIPPQTLNFNATYTVPKASFFPKAVNQSPRIGSSAGSRTTRAARS